MTDPTSTRATRLKVSASIDIDRPQDEVFAYLCDVRRHEAWSPKPFRVEGLDADENGRIVIEKGTRFVSYGWLPSEREHRNDVEVTELEAPSRLVLTATDRGAEFVNTFVVTPTADGCTVTRSMDLPRPAGFAGRLAPIVVIRVIKPDLQKGLKQLRTLLQGPLKR